MAPFSQRLLLCAVLCHAANAATLTPLLHPRVHSLSGGQVAYEEPAPVEVAAVTTEVSPEVGTPLSEKLASEFVGTFLLFLAAVCSGAEKSPVAPLAVAAILTGLIYAFGPVSGAIFNPAVLVAFVLRGKMALTEALQFAGVQTGGAMLAGLAGRVLYGSSVAPTIAGSTAELGSWGRALLSEVLFTFTSECQSPARRVSCSILAQRSSTDPTCTPRFPSPSVLSVVLHAACTKAQEENDVVSMAIGLTVFGCIVCASASGSAFNPAGTASLHPAPLYPSNRR